MKNKTTAGLLAIFLGGLGIHKFYLGQNGLGILYLIFVWTFIPAFIGFIEGLCYFSMSDKDFNKKYNGIEEHQTITEETKLCPHCAERILAKATKCKHCKSDLNTNER